MGWGVRGVEPVAEAYRGNFDRLGRKNAKGDRTDYESRKTQPHITDLNQLERRKQDEPGDMPEIN